MVPTKIDILKIIIDDILYILKRNQVNCIKQVKGTI